MIPWNYNAFPEICEASKRGVLLACNILGPRRIAINNLGLVSIQFSDESANLSLTSSVLPIQQLVGSKYEHVRRRATLDTLNPRGPSAILWLSHELRIDARLHRSKALAIGFNAFERSVSRESDITLRRRQATCLLVTVLPLLLGNLQTKLQYRRSGGIASPCS